MIQAGRYFRKGASSGRRTGVRAFLRYAVPGLRVSALRWRGTGALGWLALATAIDAAVVTFAPDTQSAPAAVGPKTAVAAAVAKAPATRADTAIAADSTVRVDTSAVADSALRADTAAISAIVDSFVSQNRVGTDSPAGATFRRVDSIKPPAPDAAASMRKQSPFVHGGRAAASWVRRNILSLFVVALVAGLAAVVGGSLLRRGQRNWFLDSARLSIMDKEVQRACRYIEEHYADSTMDMQRVCSGLVTGAAFLEGLFLRELGMSVDDFIRQVRVNRARLILAAAPEVSLSQLCGQVGFSSPDALTEAFHAVTGITIEQFAASSRQKNA